MKAAMKHFKKLISILTAMVFILSVFLTPLPTRAVSGTTASAGSGHIQNAAAADSGEDIKLYAGAAVLMDAGSGRILYQKNSDKILPMASTTKIMTCILALEYGNLADYAQTSSYASSMPKVKLYAKPGEFFQLKDLLHSLMLESHNDTAVIIAEHIAGSTESFANLMNQKARDLGCFDTYFITPNGLDATVSAADGSAKSHSTTAADLARIMSYCIMDSPQKDAFLEITRTASYSFNSYKEENGSFVPSGRSFHCSNHNAFLTMMDGALSGKTGFTGNAGYCYVGALRQDERTFVVALLACGWPNNKSYKWSDTKALMRYGLDQFEYHLIDEVSYDPALLKPIPVSGGQTDQLDGHAFVPVELRRNPSSGQDAIDSQTGLLLKKGETIQVDLQMEQELSAPVYAGTEVGRIRYLVDDTPYRVEYIMTAKDIPAIDYSWCIRQVLQRFSIY